MQVELSLGLEGTEESCSEAELDHRAQSREPDC